MRYVLTVKLGSVLALLCFYDVVAVADPKLVCENPSYNFGKIEEGELVERSFVVKNAGDAPADMRRLRTQCGCAIIDVAQDNLAPGAKASMTLKVSLGKLRGPIHKNVTILSEESKQDVLTLTFEGTITSTLSLTPERVVLGRMNADQEVMRSVVVAFTQRQPVKITRVVSDPAGILASDITTLQDGSRYRVTVRAKPSKGMAAVQGRVLLYTDSAKHPMIDIPVTGTVWADVVAIPREILLTSDPKPSAVRYVWVRSPKDRPFEIKGIECPLPSVKAKVEPMGPGKYRLEITGLTCDEALDSKRLLVKTTVASMPLLEIPLRIGGATAGRRGAGKVPNTAADDLSQQIAALEKQLRSLPAKPAEPLIQAAVKLEALAEKLVKEKGTSAARTKQSDTLFQIGTTLLYRARGKEHDDDGMKLLNHAKDAIAKCAALADYGTTAPVNRLYALAQLQARLGQRAEAAATYGKLSGMLVEIKDSKLSRLWVEHLRIEQLTTKDSPEFRTLTEAALADFEQRGGSDVFEGTMRHELAMSYRKEGQYARSTELFNTNIKKDTGERIRAYDTLWVAKNAQDSNDRATAGALLQKVVAEYPGTGAAETAKAELQWPIYQDLALEAKRNSGGFWKKLLVGTDVLTIGVLVTIFVGRRLRRKESLGGK